MTSNANTNNVFNQIAQLSNGHSYID